jgi:hypothetical protein
MTANFVRQIFNFLLSPGIRMATLIFLLAFILLIGIQFTKNKDSEKN